MGLLSSRVGNLEPFLGAIIPLMGQPYDPEDSRALALKALNVLLNVEPF